MADMFFALVAVVIFMLLALVPMIAAAGSTPAPSGPDALWQSPIKVDQQEAAVFVAGQAGLQVIGPDARSVAVDAILEDVSLASQLRRAAAERRPVLIGIEPGGGEAAFLFDALAGTLALPEVNQIRVDAACRHVIEQRLRQNCLVPTGVRKIPR